MAPQPPRRGEMMQAVCGDRVTGWGARQVWGQVHSRRHFGHIRPQSCEARDPGPFDPAGRWRSGTAGLSGALWRRPQVGPGFRCFESTSRTSTPHSPER
ncbi:hypothetical protein AAFF_G00390450 [Aldrovandia affinis]|uniref:Uncharacterized protein n=1 Tax=Aldrovandia affinis TaxID=143900 RepID=A0AAD7SEV0_9TELE|nr:hypothetical protein AAFF_G00390450 [Aldrovandia affinis]